VTEYIWANPHVFVKVDAKDESGNTVHWVIEAQNLVQQSTLGWTNTTFKPGDQVVIDVTPSKNGRPIGRFKGRIVINGQPFKP
jgi:ribosomal protein L21E